MHLYLSEPYQAIRYLNAMNVTDSQNVIDVAAVWVTRVHSNLLTNARTTHLAQQDTLRYDMKMRGVKI